MVKRRERVSTSEEDVEIELDSPATKRHKKHRHKKHRRRLESSDAESEQLQAKMKPQGLVRVKPVDRALPSTSSTPKPISGKKKKGKGRESGTSSEEERWLDAIESGKLEDVDDELKKMKPKDPKLMTARQRAMYERGTDKEVNICGEALMALPTGYKEKVMTAEALMKAALKSQKRKQLADEKREKDKRKTMERLLKKQESKTSKSSKLKPVRSMVPMVSYKLARDLHLLSFPKDVPFPLEAATTRPPKPKVYCAMKCGNAKKYSCSRTGVPLCSLECYKRNIAQCIL